MPFPPTGFASLEPLASDDSLSTARVMLPDDANPAGNVHGGTILKMIEQVGAARFFRVSVGGCVAFLFLSFFVCFGFWVGNLSSEVPLLFVVVHDSVS